jgi:hypothetical protein
MSCARFRVSFSTIPGQDMVVRSPLSSYRAPSGRSRSRFSSRSGFQGKLSNTNWGEKSSCRRMIEIRGRHGFTDTSACSVRVLELELWEWT